VPDFVQRSLSRITIYKRKTKVNLKHSMVFKGLTFMLVKVFILFKTAAHHRYYE